MAERRRLGVVAGTVLAGLAALPGAAPADVLFDESFRGPTASEPFAVRGSTGWRPCLTASVATTQAPIPGCAAGSPSVDPGGDAPGTGALRLTDNGTHRAGSVIHTEPLPLTAGVRLTFDAFAYRGQRVPGFGAADGIAIFLADGTEEHAPGAFGGSLGYAQSNDDFDSPASAPATIPGVPGGYVGLGIDEFGNFANDREARGAGCATRADRNLHAQSLAVRGPGTPGSDWLEGYCLLTPALSVGALDAPDAVDRDAPGVGNRFALEVDPPRRPGARIRLAVDLDRDGTVDGRLDEPLPPDPPETFVFGLASSTGDGTNIHELQNLRIESVLPLPRWTLAKAHEGELAAGARGTFVLRAGVATGGGPATLPVLLEDALPPGVRVAGEPRGTGWACDETVVGTRAVRCTYAIDAPVPAGTALPPVQIPVDVAPDARGELVNVATLAGDELPEPLRAEDPFTVSREADLRVRKVTRDGTSHAIVVSNRGPADADAVTLVDEPGPGLWLVRAEPSAGRCTVAPRRMTCTLGTLRAGAAAQVVVTAEPVAGAQELANTARAESETPDPHPADNADTTTTPVPAVTAPSTEPSPSAAARIVLTKAATPTAVRVGRVVEYVVRAENRGGAAARRVLLVDAASLPARVLSARPSAGTCTVRDRLVLCRVGDLAPGTAVEVRVRARVLRAGTSANVAAAVAEGALPATARARVRVRGGAALQLRKSSARRVYELGEVVRFRLRLRHAGDTAAEAVRVCDTLPTELRLVRAPGAARSGPRRVCWALPGLGPGAERTFTLDARTTAATPRARNRATAEAANTGRVFAARAVAVVDPCPPAAAAAAPPPRARAAC